MYKLREYYPDMMKLFNSLGFSFSYLKTNFEDFIKYCEQHFPDIETITKECALEWIYSKECKSKKVLNDRIVAIKHFSEYLTSIGIDSYTPTIYIGYDYHKPVSLLNDEQLKIFFDYADSLHSCASSPNREYIGPVIFRLIYTCGLRNSEAANIKMKNINLINGTVNIIHSKGDKDRIIYMDDTVLELCMRFDKVQSVIFPDREYFFTISNSRTHPTIYNIDDLFDKILYESGLAEQFVIKPTVHGLRHLFAVNNMRKCLETDRNMDVHIKYLSQYMGHETIKQTMYYLHIFESLLPALKEKTVNLTKGIGVAYEEF